MSASKEGIKKICLYCDNFELFKQGRCLFKHIAKPGNDSCRAWVKASEFDSGKDNIKEVGKYVRNRK